MKKYWLRGVLLGVSMALLLAGGVALAASLRIEAHPNCFVCTPKGAAPHRVDLDIGGYPVMLPAADATSSVARGFEFALFTYLGPPAFIDWYSPDDPECTISLWVPCSENGMYVELEDQDCWGLLRDEIAPSNTDIFAQYGEWTARVCEDGFYSGDAEAAIDGCAEVQFLFTRDPSVCAEREFVPEPGSIVLLASGLTGLAGYATLRWRSRE